jgi:hypothetical protein
MLVRLGTRTIFCATFASMLIITSCSGDKKSAAPPKTGTLAHSWYAANESWKAGDYDRTLQHLSRLSVAQSEYRERARQWVIVASAGIADGYRELADAYEAGARISRQSALDYRRRVSELRNAASSAAMLYAETIHDTMNREKDLKFKFDFPFPAGSASEPAQLARISKGLPVQQADHDAAKAAMAKRGIVRFASSLASADGDAEKAKAQFAEPPREVAVAAVARNLIGLADLYCNRKLDMPRRGNALCKEAEEAIALLPPNSKERKQLETKLKEEMKRHVVKT